MNESGRGDANEPCESERHVGFDRFHRAYDADPKWQPSRGRSICKNDSYEVNGRQADEVARTLRPDAPGGLNLYSYELLPRLFPHYDMRRNFVGNPALAEQSARLNGALQAGYFMMAARALGLDCGPMGGFDAAKVDAEFFAGTTWRALFLCNLGHGDASKLHPRGPRLDFDEACAIV